MLLLTGLRSGFRMAALFFSILVISSPLAAEAAAAGPAQGRFLNDGGVGSDGNGGGDAHRVTGLQQVVQEPSVEIIPELDSQTVGFCNTYTVIVRDPGGVAIQGANVDVHAVGPSDDLQFATNADDPDAAGDDVSDPFSPPDDLVPPPDTHLVEPGAGCDIAGEAPPGDAPEDNDSNSTGLQGVHINVGGADTKHIEGTTDADGFEFSVDSETAGNTTITAWYDVVAENDVRTSDEPQDQATKTWQAPVAAEVDAVPEDDTNDVGATHEVTATVRDQNGNPMSGQTVHFRVTAGPHADENLDADGATPPGYFSACTTDANGRCSDQYTGSQQGLDTITVFVNSAGETGNAVFAADGDDPQDVVHKLWEATCPGFENDPRNQVVGTPGDDNLEGTPGKDIICGRGGDDEIDGRGDADLLIGGPGNDTVKGARGADELRGGGGADTLLGGKGPDTVKGGSGGDTLKGGRGADEVRGEGGGDTLLGGTGSDTLKGGSGGDTLKGGDGPDELKGGPGPDVLRGGKGTDFLNGGPGKDDCKGGPGKEAVKNCED